MSRPNDTCLDQAGDLLAEIANSARSTDQLCFRFCPDADDVEHYELHVEMLRKAVQRIGWLADLCAGKLGRSTTVGDAEAWMAPPLFNARARGDV